MTVFSCAKFLFALKANAFYRTLVAALKVFQRVWLTPVISKCKGMNVIWLYSLELQVFHPDAQELFCFVCRVEYHLEITFFAGHKGILPAGIQAFCYAVCVSWLIGGFSL